jgi:hypothetical protein
MVKKKRDRVDVEDLIARPWCYYCERDFDDQKVLISHQKAKHFKCDKCNRRLNTAGGLSVHLQQVHKETLTAVENAMEGRQGVEPEVFGMMGIPEELLNAHRQRILNEFFKQEADRRAATGNPPPGQKTGEPNAKKRKLETPEELKARLAEHRAKRAAEKQAEAEGKVLPKSTSNTPVPTQGNAVADVQPVSLSPNREHDKSATDTRYQELPLNPQPSYGHMQPNLPQFPPPHPSLPHPSLPLHPGLPLQSPLGGGFPPSFPAQQPGRWPPHMPSPSSFSPSQAAPYATPPFMPPVHSPMAGQMPGSMMPIHNMRYSQSPNTERQPSVPTPSALQSAPGLPARPSFDLPNFNREDMQRMHTGQVPPPTNIMTKPPPASVPHRLAPSKPMSDAVKAEVNLPTSQNGSQGQHTNGAALKLTVPEVTNEGLGDAAAASTATPATTKERSASLKKKKSKPAITRLVYSDDQESPEEKRAKWGKYAITLNDGPEFVEGEIGGAVTGVTVDEDTVLDVQD